MADTAEIRDGLFYSREHEWVCIEGTTATVGVSDYAQHELGDVVYVELPTVGLEVKRNGEMGVVESVKAASDIYSPVDGFVSEVNEELESHPEFINQDPYGKGWIARVSVSGPEAAEGLMDAAAYRALVEAI